MQRDNWGKWAMIIALIVIVVAGVYMVSSVNNRRVSMSLGGQVVYARVASTDSTRQKGLSGTKQLTDAQAMLFIFDTPGRWGMWMKDMNYSLDMLWLDDDKRIISMEQNVAPSTYPEAFLPDKAARYVVELPAGFVQRHRVEQGQVVGFSAP